MHARWRYLRNDRSIWSLLFPYAPVIRFYIMQDIWSGLLSSIVSCLQHSHPWTPLLYCLSKFLNHWLLVLKALAISARNLHLSKTYFNVWNIRIVGNRVNSPLTIHGGCWAILVLVPTYKAKVATLQHVLESTSKKSNKTLQQEG